MLQPVHRVLAGSEKVWRGWHIGDRRNDLRFEEYQHLNAGFHNDGVAGYGLPEIILPRVACSQKMNVLESMGILL